MSGDRCRVRRAGPGDESILRALRLQAMTDSPEAFGSTYERELARTALDWQQWLSTGVTFILDQPEGAVGLVAGRHAPDDAAVVHLMAMWVHPSARGSGGADALVDALVAWAEAERATVVRLDVIASNPRARAFYERHGFRMTGGESTRDRDGLVQTQMGRRLEPRS